MLPGRSQRLAAARRFRRGSDFPGVEVVAALFQVVAGRAKGSTSMARFSAANDAVSPIS